MFNPVKDQQVIANGNLSGIHPGVSDDKIQDGRIENNIPVVGEEQVTL